MDILQVSSHSKMRYQTMQEKMGIHDGDLSTARHDAIMIWLDANIETIINDGKLVNIDRFWNKGIIDNLRAKAEKFYLDFQLSVEQYNIDADAKNRSIEKRIENAPSAHAHAYAHTWDLVKVELKELAPDWNGVGDPPERPKCLMKKTWECPVMKGEGQYATIVGFVDLGVDIKIPHIGLHNAAIDYSDYTGKHPLESGKFPTWAVWMEQTRSIVFEVKPKIQSLGEVIRQIRTYQRFCPSWDYVVVSPDDLFADQLSQQDIGFLKVPAEALVKN